MPSMLGRYVLGHRIAAGGMGEVFHARQTGPDGFDRPCVVKTIQARLAAEPELIELFLEEARLSARLNHSNIAQVYDFGKVGDTYYIAMEVIDGPPLRTIIKAHLAVNRRFDLGIALRLVSQAAQALDYAHRVKGADGVALNMVHRDISPANLLVSRQGLVKVIDFGIARARTTERVTQVGIVRGNVNYMSPEQVLGQPLDGRADVYGLGLVLYELLALRRAQRVKSLIELARAQNTQIEPLTTLRPDCPKPVLQIVARSLERKRELRFQSAGQMAEIIEGTIVSLGLTVTAADITALVDAYGVSAAPEATGISLSDLGVGDFSPAGEVRGPPVPDSVPELKPVSPRSDAREKPREESELPTQMAEIPALAALQSAPRAREAPPVGKPTVVAEVPALQLLLSRRPSQFDLAAVVSEEAAATHGEAEQDDEATNPGLEVAPPASSPADGAEEVAEVDAADLSEVLVDSSADEAPAAATVDSGQGADAPFVPTEFTRVETVDAAVLTAVPTVTAAPAQPMLVAGRLGGRERLPPTPPEFRASSRVTDFVNVADTLPPVSAPEGSPSGATSPGTGGGRLASAAETDRDDARSTQTSPSQTLARMRAELAQSEREALAAAEHTPSVTRPSQAATRRTRVKRRSFAGFAVVMMAVGLAIGWFGAQCREGQGGSRAGLLQRSSGISH